MAGHNARLDQRFMSLALALGRRGLGRTWPNPAVGAVVVKDGIIVGRGWTQPSGRPHAEVEALRRAGEARRAHAGHIRRVQDGRPHVILKLAVSADGKVGLAGRKPSRITGDEATARVHLMRSRSDAVVTGIGTVLADDPLLTCRLPGMGSPVRVVLDGALRLPLASKLVATAREAPLWVVTSEAAER